MPLPVAPSKHSPCPLQALSLLLLSSVLPVVAVTPGHALPHSAPKYPASHSHPLAVHAPWPPHGSGDRAVSIGHRAAQSAPPKPRSQAHSPDASSHTPCPEHAAAVVLLVAPPLLTLLPGHTPRHRGGPNRSAAHVRLALS